MIARIWRGRAALDKADAYRRHVTQTVFPALTAIPGHRGAYLLNREADGQIEFLAITLWQSVEAVKRFAGEGHEKAVVEPEAQEALAEFDPFVRHYEVAHAAGAWVTSS